MSVIVKGTGGSTLQRTVLWTNANPSDSSGFSAQDVTLSESIAHFDYIGVKSLLWYSDGSEKLEALVPSSALSAYAGSNQGRWTMGYFGSSNDQYTRYITYVNNTKVNISANYKINASGTLNKGNIPTQIYGIKFS